VARDLRERSIDTYDSTEYRTIECLRSTICPPVNQGMIAHCASAVSEILWAGSTAGGLPESESRRMTGCIPTGLMSPHLRRLLRAPIPILLAVGARTDQGPENDASRKSDRSAAHGVVQMSARPASIAESGFQKQPRFITVFPESSA